MKVIVTGGRAYGEKKRVYEELDKLKEEGMSLVIQGGCASGADHYARLWAAETGFPLCSFPTHWTTLGSQAGPMRNSWMIQFGNPDLVLAFPGGKGTADMVGKAKALDIPVREVT